MSHRRKATLRWVILSVVLLLAVILAGASWYMTDFALMPTHNKGRNMTLIQQRLHRDYPELTPWLDSLQENHALRDTSIVNRRGDHLHGIYIVAPRPTDRVAVVVHGYTDCAVYMLPWAKVYLDMGYNVVLPELYGNGHSDGDHQQMGWLDRLDVLRWLPLADHRFAPKGGHTQMVVHGISMGAATTMCVAGERTPDYVRAFVEDCGYTSAWDEFSYEMHQQFGLPEFPLLYTSSALCRLRFGWSFGEASPLRQVARCHKPMLFIHGTHDTFVPTAMVFPLYRAKPQPKQLWLAKGSAHARSLHDHPKEYAQTVARFVGKYIKP